MKIFKILQAIQQAASNATMLYKIQIAHAAVIYVYSTTSVYAEILFWKGNSIYTILRGTDFSGDF